MPHGDLHRSPWAHAPAVCEVSLPPWLERGERLASQVLAALAADREVVLDADAAELAQCLDPWPVDVPAVVLGPRRLEQLVDEVDARFHGHHEPRLEHARQSQEGVAFRARDVPALG